MVYVGSQSVKLDGCEWVSRLRLQLARHGILACFEVLITFVSSYGYSYIEHVFL